MIKRKEDIPYRNILFFCLLADFAPIPRYIYVPASFFVVSELCVFGRTWEWDYVAYVLHACDKQDEPLKSQAETGMWA